MNGSLRFKFTILYAVIGVVVLLYLVQILPQLQKLNTRLYSSKRTITVEDYPTFDGTQFHRNIGSRSRSGRRNVITMLVKTISPMMIKHQIRMLDIFFKDENRSDFLVFHEDFPLSETLKEIRRNTHRNVEFVNVEPMLRSVPRFKKFDPYKTDPFWSKGGKWAYQSMIRFWFSDIFLLPVMDDVDYFLRIDDDSIFSDVFPNLFDQVKMRKGVYMANNIKVEEANILPGTDLLKDMASKYVESNAVNVKDKLAWENAFPDDSIQMYYNNFEVSSVPFFRRAEVLKWTKAVLDSGGIFLYRWGDAPLRYLTLALFANPQEVLHRGVDFNMSYCHPVSYTCKYTESMVDEAPPE